jgi:hypothetical protein
LIRIDVVNEYPSAWVGVTLYNHSQAEKAGGQNDVVILTRWRRFSEVIRVCDEYRTTWAIIGPDGRRDYVGDAGECGEVSVAGVGCPHIELAHLSA